MILLILYKNSRLTERLYIKRNEPTTKIKTGSNITDRIHLLVKFTQHFIKVYSLEIKSQQKTLVQSKDLFPAE